MPLPLASALVTAVIILCSLPALRGGFVYDDHFIAEHPLFDGVDNLLPSFIRTSHDYVPNIVETATGVLYRPLPAATFVATNVVFGRVPLPHHLVSLALHLVISALIISLGCDLRTSRVPALAVLAGFVYGLHPLTA